MTKNKLINKTPFTPGIVKHEEFVGRKDIINNIQRYLPNIYDGENRHFYLTGNRWMGKSSACNYLANILEQKYDVITIKIQNDAIDDINMLIIKFIEALLNNPNFNDKIVDDFRDYITGVRFMGYEYKIIPESEEIINYIRRDFPIFIHYLCSKLDEKRAIFVIIDDVNSLSKTPDFANWYKAFVDNLTMRFKKETPIAFILTSTPDTLEKLKKHNPSFSRIFYHNDVEALTNNEVKTFYTHCFDESGINYDDTIIEMLSKYSYGIHLMMQELGENIYWKCETDTLNIKQVTDAIKDTNKVICEKYLDPIIKNTAYQKVLEQIGSVIQPNIDTFSINKLKENSTDEEKVLIDLFIMEAKNSEILYQEEYGLKDECKFINPLYSVYLKNNNF